MRKLGKWFRSLLVLSVTTTSLMFAVGVAEAAPEFTVNTGTVLQTFVGHGTEYNQNLYASISAVDGITTSNVGDLEAKVDALGSQHVRIFFDTKAFDTVNYPDYMSSFIQTVELAQASGSTVNITYWHGPYTNVNTQMQDFADVLYDLRVTRGLTAVQYVTIQNEVNSTSITQSDYESFYRALAADLTTLGIRSSIKLIGGDLVNTNQASWFTYMGNNMADVLDGYSVHIYWDYDNKSYGITRLDDVRTIVSGLPSGAQKPVYINEYGVRGDKTTCPDPGCVNGTSTPISDTTISAFEQAWFHFNALNRRFVATVKWDAYKAKYDNGSQYYSEIGIGTDGYPLKPSYNMSRLLTQTAKPGWQILSTTGSVAGKTVTALKSATGSDMAVYALNDTGASTTISIGGLPANKKFAAFAWNEEGTGGTKAIGDVQTNGSGQITLTMADEAFVALTTVATDELEQVATYHFDETSGTTADDASLFSHNGTLANGATWTSSGKFNGALRLDGVNDYVRTASFLNPGKSKGFSAMAWVKQAASSATARYILQQEGTTGRIWLLVKADGTLQTNIGNVATISTGTVPVGQWSYVGVTYDGTTVRLYINGKLDTTATVTAESSTGDMLIGSDKPFTSTSFWNGDIDELSIYNRKLTVENIKDVYTAGYWRFDESSGTTGNDSAGPNDAVTWFNSPTWVTGKMGNAIDLDGVNDYGTTPFLLNPSVTPFTAAAWVKLDTASGTGQFILQQDGTLGRIWLCRTSTGNLETYIGNSALISSGTIPVGTWTHVAVTYDGTTARLYLNGVLDGSAARTAESTTSGMFVGVSKVNDQRWNGLIDNMRIYSRKLTDSEIKDLFNTNR